MKRIHQLMEQGIAEHYFQSACLLVSGQGQPIIHQAYGKARLDTLFDLASLTKPLATTSVVMQLVAEGKLSIQRKVNELIPELSQPEARKLEIWHLLIHASGLPNWLPLYEQVESKPPDQRRSVLRQLVAQTALLRPPGCSTVYSDLGFILLDWALERLTGQRLDHLFSRYIAQPLGLHRTFFVDLLHSSIPAGQSVAAPWNHFSFAPTERCPWRKRRLIGEVHDENCAAMGGISGHAGLFSTAYELHLLAREVVAAYYQERSIFHPHVTANFLNFASPPNSTRVLGWDTPSATGASSGRYFSPTTVGHLGFTGTSLWIDLERNIGVVLLTNRVYYGREPNPLRAFRPKLHDAIMRSLKACMKSYCAT